MLSFSLSLLMSVFLLSLNVNGLRDPTKRGGLLHWLRAFPSLPDFVCLQETHCASVAECSSWFLSSGYSFVSSPGSVKSCGCILLFRTRFTLVRSFCDAEGRFLCGEFSFSDQVFRVACFYAPNRNPARNDFFEDVADRLDPTVPTIVCGDFNTVIDRALDRAGSDAADTLRESTVALSHLFDSVCVTDIWRYLHPDASAFTWNRWNGSISSRIDMVGVPFSWVPSVAGATICPCPFSDHCAVTVSVSVPDVVPPGPGLWKLNTSILHDQDYVDLITGFWRRWRLTQARFSSLSKWWEKGK